MDIDEFEAQTRDQLESALNQLQTATLLLSALERQILESGTTVKNLSSVVETFIADQRNHNNTSLPQ